MATTITIPHPKQDLYKGYVIKQSLKNPNIINQFYKIGKPEIYDEGTPDQWDVYTVRVRPEQIELIRKNIKKNGKWYTHFFNGDQLIIVYPERIFTASKTHKDTWLPAIKYGLSEGIPIEQLDFTN